MNCFKVIWLLNNLPEIIESIINCIWFDNNGELSIAASDKYDAMFLDNILFPLCKNFTATGKTLFITSFLL